MDYSCTNSDVHNDNQQEDDQSILSDDASDYLFCTLCLRKCGSEFLLEFGSSVDCDSKDAEQKVNQALGLSLELDFCSVCHTCWKLIQVIAEYKNSCTKAASVLEKFQLGLPNEDKWTSRGMQKGIDQLQKIIQNHAALIDAQLEWTKSESAEIDTEPPIDLEPVHTEEVCSSPHFTENDLKDDELEAVTENTTANQKEFEVVDDKTEHPEEETTDQPATASRKSAAAAFKFLKLDKDHHTVNIFTCTICNRNFDGKRALVLHNTRCTAEAPWTREYFSCPICTASFLERCALTFHLNKHRGIRPYKCRKFCDRTYSSNFSRMKHEAKRCELDGRICPICGSTHKNEGALEMHMQSVHGEAKYACDICGKKFKTTNTCQDHKRVHSNERNYVCTECNKRFKSPRALVMHKRLHSQDRPFACHMCERSFIYKALLKTHIERYHGCLL